MRFRSGLRRIRAQGFEWLGLGARARRHLDGRRAAVLMYHRVLPAAEARHAAVEPGMYVTPETFARHLEWLAEDFRVLPLHEILDRLAAGRPLPHGACALTFDDGWRDNHEHALPALAARKLPATLFVVTERIGSGGAFWPDEVCRRLALLEERERWAIAGRLGAGPGSDATDALVTHLKQTPEAPRETLLAELRRATPDPAPRPRELLDWDEIEALAAAGVDIESHGATHAILPGLPEERLGQELRASLEALRARGHARHGLFAYPSGAYDERVAEMTRRAGYRAALTTERGLWAADTDLRAVPRFGLHDDVSRTRAEFRFRVSA